MGSDIRLTAADLANVDGYFGEAYAIPTPEGDAAVLLLARTEAIFLDPTYTGKSMSALIDHIQTGQIGPDETVVFDTGLTTMEAWRARFEAPARQTWVKQLLGA